jgi:hypothetical protein
VKPVAPNPPNAPTARVVGDADGHRGLHHDVVDADIGSVGARPGRGNDFLAPLAQLNPERIRGRIGRGAERIDAIATDRGGKAAGAHADRRGDIVERVEGMSLRTAVDPVAIAICATAVSEGVAVTFWRANHALVQLRQSAVARQRA